MKYAVEIMWMCQSTLVVEAESPEEARAKATSINIDEEWASDDQYVTDSMRIVNVSKVQ